MRQTITICLAIYLRSEAPGYAPLKPPAAILVVLFLLCAPPAGHAEESSEQSEKEEKRFGNFLPIPIIVTEPAIGEGLGAGLVYFHKKPDTVPKAASGRSLARTARKQKPPPTASGIAGFYTNNDTYAFGLGHARTFKDDTWRMTAALASARINATYYLGDLPFDFRLDGVAALGNVKRRLGNSNWFVGFAASYVDAESRFFDLDAPEPEADFTDVGVAVMGVYDTRDDSMMPSSGQVIDLTVWKYDDGIGGDFDYWTSRLKINSFHRFGEKFVLGLRFEGSTAEGDNPFYAEPFVSLRGIPALRYSGDSAGVVETELRYQIAERWSVLAFAGVGFVNEIDDVGQIEEDIDAWGIGGRWLALREENVWIGVDLARGPEEDAFYIQLTHPW